jgi:hypothetical protein
MKGCTFQAILFNPSDRVIKYFRAIMIESENKTSVDLNPMVVKQGYAPRVVGCVWALLALVTKVVVVE